MNTHKRYLGVELLKALGIISVLIMHSTVWIYICNDQGGLRYPQGQWILDIIWHCGMHFFPLMLPALAAMTFFFSVYEKKMTWKKVVSRACILALLAYAMNLVTWGMLDEDDIFDWDFLQFIGLCMIISYPFIKAMPKVQSYVGLGLLSAFSLSFSSWYPLPALGQNYLYIIFFGDSLGENYWPFCPWFSIFAAGIVLAFLIHTNSRLLRFVPLTGALFLAVSLFSGKVTLPVDTSNVWGPAAFKTPVLFLCGVIGFYLSLYAVIRYVVNRCSKVKSWLVGSPLISYAQGILWIYIITIVISFNITRYIFSHFTISYHGSLVLLMITIIYNLLLGYLVGRLITAKKKFTYI